MTLESYHPSDQAKLERALAPILSKIDSSSESETAALVIEHMESLTAQEPREWIYWVVLGDWRMRAQLFAKAVEACQRAADLRQDDLLSTYALASAYRALTNAVYLDHPRFTPEMKSMSEELAVFPDQAKAGLDELGISLSVAAERCISLFKRALSLSSGADKREIEDTLEALRSAFPDSIAWVMPS